MLKNTMSLTWTIEERVKKFRLTAVYLRGLSPQR